MVVDVAKRALKDYGAKFSHFYDKKDVRVFVGISDDGKNYSVCVSKKAIK